MLDEAATASDYYNESPDELGVMIHAFQSRPFEPFVAIVIQWKPFIFIRNHLNCLHFNFNDI
jgi:hypothetical protein